MPESLIAILTQLPVVAVFIWYSDRKDSQFREFLREERAARKEQLDALGQELRAVRQELSAAITAGHTAKRAD